MLKIKKNNPDKIALLLLFAQYIFYLASMFLSDLSEVSVYRIAFYLVRSIVFCAFYAYCFFDENKTSLFIRVYSIMRIYAEVSNMINIYSEQWSAYWMSIFFSVLYIIFYSVIIFETFKESRKLSIAGLMFLVFYFLGLIISHISNFIRYIDYAFSYNPYKDIGHLLNVASAVIMALLAVYVYFKYYKKKHYIKKEDKEFVSVEKNIFMAEETLESIKEQFDNGQISEEEYNRKKTEIINAL